MSRLPNAPISFAGSMIALVDDLYAPRNDQYPHVMVAMTEHLYHHFPEKDEPDTVANFFQTFSRLVQPNQLFYNLNHYAGKAMETKFGEFDCDPTSQGQRSVYFSAFRKTRSYQRMITLGLLDADLEEIHHLEFSEKLHVYTKELQEPPYEKFEAFGQLALETANYWPFKKASASGAGCFFHVKAAHMGLPYLFPQDGINLNQEMVFAIGRPVPFLTRFMDCVEEQPNGSLRFKSGSLLVPIEDADEAKCYSLRVLGDYQPQSLPSDRLIPFRLSNVENPSEETSPPQHGNYR